MKRVQLVIAGLLVGAPSCRTMERWANADVSFDVQKVASGLELIGTERGARDFRAQITGSGISVTVAAEESNFHVQKVGDAFVFQYRSADDAEALDLFVQPDGKTSLAGANHTVWDAHRSYGIRTFGTLETKGAQAFYSLATVASQFHNYGALHASFAQFCQDYFYNVGVIRAEEICMDAEPAGLVTVVAQASGVGLNPVYKKHTVENRGQIISSKKLHIKGGLNYIERGAGNFEDLETSGGDFTIEAQKEVFIGGNLTGRVRNVAVGDGGSVVVQNMGISHMQDLTIGHQGLFQSPNTYSLYLNGHYSNAGELVSGKDLSVHLENVPWVRQTGHMVAHDTLNFSARRTDQPKNSTNAPKITEDPIARAKLLQRELDANGAEFQRLRDDFYRRRGYQPDQQRGSGADLPKLARKIREIIYTDHYLNTITYVYAVDAFGFRTQQIINVTETGYIWQNRTQETREYTVTLPAELEQLFKGGESRLATAKADRQTLVATLKELAALEAAARQLLDRAQFLSKLAQLMQAGGAAADDARGFLYDPYLRDLAEFDALPEPTQAELTRIAPQLAETLDLIDDARYELRGQLRWMPPGARDFIRDWVIPALATAALLTPPTAMGAATREVVVLAAARCSRVLPVLAGAATAVAAADAYQKAVLFFKGAGSNGGEKPEPEKGPSAGERVRNSPMEVRNYIKGLRDIRALDRSRRYGKYITYRIRAACRYKGYEFKEGTIISKDTLHNEIEVFKDEFTHLGAIEPKGGTLYKGPDATRALRR